VLPAEFGVALALPSGDVRAGAGEEFVGDAAAAAVHGVVGDGHAVEVGIDDRQRVIEIRSDQIRLPDRSPPILRERFRRPQRFREPIRHVGQRRRAARRNELDPVVRRRVVARGHLQRPREPPIRDRPRDHRRRGVTFRDERVEAVDTEHAGQFLGGRPRSLTRIVADGDGRVLALG